MQTLPRSRELTDALVAPPAHVLCDAAIASARERLEDGLAGAIAESPAPRGSRVLRVGAYQLANPSIWSPPFRWTAGRARRQVGLAAVRACLDGRAGAPADAVSLVVADPAGPDGVGRSEPGSCADWLASLAPAARAAVIAEATTFATRLWTALDWAGIEREHSGAAVRVGGADRWWRWSGGTLHVALRGRVDVRLATASLTVLDGLPSASTRSTLTLSALVDALTRRVHQVPARVVGWWPDSGKAWIVPIDEAALIEGADAVTRVVRALLGAMPPGGGLAGGGGRR